MNSLTFENPAIGQEIDLISDQYVRLTSITGVSSTGQIGTQAVTGKDGATPTFSVIPARQIIVNFRIRKGVDAEQAMHDLYRIFAVKSSGTMTFVGRLGASKIDYIVQSCEIPPNAETLVGMATLICPDPYFRAETDAEAVIAGSESVFMFPYTFPDTSFYISRRIASLFAEIYNDGEADTGMVIRMTAEAKVVNPAIISVDTGQAARLNFTMQAGDVITITTGQDNKHIMLTRGGVTTNIFNRTIFPFTFFELKQGANVFTYSAESGMDDLDIEVAYTARFGAMYTNAPAAINARMTYDEIERRVEQIAEVVQIGGIYG